ncbi:MAG TPA: DUF4199 domain-containing protein [Paludibacter sp.]|nr:DUF4199 domain-containing protein [Paludibacter sp.]
MQRNMIKSTMQSGLTIGFLLSLKFLLSTSNNQFISLLALCVSILVIVALYQLTARSRKNEFGGTMTYWQAFGYVFQSYFFGTIISSLVILTYMSLNPAYLEMLLDTTLKMYDRIKLPLDPSTYDTAKTFYKPAPYALIVLFSSTLVGTFWALILATFLKKEKSIFEE